MKKEVLRVEKVTQKKDGMVRLDNLNFHIFKGEVMGMIFLTSQGKKELVDLLCNNSPISNGRVYLNGQLINNYEKARYSDQNLVHIIGQNDCLIKNLTVADNIFVMRRGLKKYVINRKLLRSQFYFWFEVHKVSFLPDSLISELTKLERCIVELFRAIVAGSKLIIIQEISSFLPADDLERFYEFIRYYKEQGISFLYIGSHHEEVFRICDRVALMKNARVIRVLFKEELTDASIKPYNISYEVEEVSEHKENGAGGILNFQHVGTSSIKDLTFSIQKGECVLFLDKGSEMQPDFIRLMQGKASASSGAIYYNGTVFSRMIAEKGVINKILLISKNPVENMVFWDLNYLENLCFLIDRKMKHIRIKRYILDSIVKEYEQYVGKDLYEKDLKKLDTRSLYSLIYYRVHLYNPNIVICIQPFAGLDMYLRKHVIDLIHEFQKKGITVIIWSVNISDCLSVADRLFLLEDGQIQRTYEKDAFYHFKEKT